ncbi:hypothetical protein [Serratia marcescens]|uniref:hypothetical protein n=1 Tax=Serratia marcescens TaxID=615 RepID=UPI00129464AF|nr:hypothetical protein [Serratia marcescens]
MVTDVICFAYPTLVRPGMVAGGIYTPEPLIANVIPEATYTLIVTAGLVLPVNKEITTEVDILFDEKSVIVQEEDVANGYLENPVTVFTDDQQVIYLSSMFVRGVSLSKHGTYTIQVSLFLNDTEGNKTGSPINCYKSYFYVSTVSEGRNGKNV